MASTLDPDRFTLAVSNRRSGLTWTGALLALGGTMGLLEILERIGFPSVLLGVIAVAVALFAFVCAGIAGRSMTVFDYDLAGHAVPAPANALAIATTLTGLALLVGEGPATAWGFAVGLGLAAVVFARAWRDSDAATMVDYIRAQYGAAAGLAARVFGLATAACAALALVVAAQAQLMALLDLGPTASIVVACGLLLLAGLPGGMRSVGAAQLAAGAMLTIAIVLAVMQDALAESAVLQDRGIAEAGAGAWAFLLAVTAGAAWPPLFMRVASAQAAVEARRACGWAALIVAGLVASPVFAAIALATAEAPDAVVDYVLAGTGLVVLAASGALAALSGARMLAGGRRGALAARALPASRRLVRARFVSLVLIAALGGLALWRPWSRTELLLWSLSLAGSAFLPLLLFARTRLKAPPPVALATIVVGPAIAAIHLAGLHFDLASGLPAAAAGPVGVAFGCIVLVGGSIVAAAEDLRRAPISTPGHPPAALPRPADERAAAP